MTAAAQALREGFDDLLAQHGEPVVIQTHAGPVLSLAGVFEDPAMAARLGQVPVEDAASIRLVCYLSAIQGARRDDIVIVRGTRHALLEIIPDGDTHATLAIMPELIDE